MISKELLSEVLKFDISHMTTKIDGHVYYRIKNRYSGDISMYELAHKCKKWANKQGYTLTVVYAPDITMVYPMEIITGERLPFVKADTEPEAIFKACEWILKEKSND